MKKQEEWPNDFWVDYAYPKVGFSRSPEYKRNPTSWPSVTPPDFSMGGARRNIRNKRPTSL